MQLPLQALAKYRKTKFKWGESDCCMFVADCCIEIGGIDPAKSFRGKYSTKIGSRMAIKRLGTIERALSNCFKEIDTNLAKRGDPVMINEHTVGINWLGGILCMSKDGVILTNEKPVKAWSVQRD